jgi:hypothetical protein
MTSNEDMVWELVRQIQTYDGSRCWDAAHFLLKVMLPKQYAEVIIALKDCVTDDKAHSTRSSKSYEVIWHCAKNMPYPEFYQAWHHPPLTPHAEVPETTGVGFTPDSQSLNLAELPELLRATLNGEAELRDKVQLICINGSKFIDRNNPATKIYNEMRSQGCPKYEDGKPKTMAQLQDYWDELRLGSERALVLVFYENPTAPQGFSDTFLDALSKFDGAICAISDQPNIPQQSFSPNQPNLVVDLVGWIRKSVLENP